MRSPDYRAVHELGPNKGYVKLSFLTSVEYNLLKVNPERYMLWMIRHVYNDDPRTNLE